jgi:uncharacterized protein YndB with AHSA1/START domain
MAGQLKVTVTKNINAGVPIVWQAFTDPDMIKQYLFGTTVTSTGNWAVASPTPVNGKAKATRTRDK